MTSDIQFILINTTTTFLFYNGEKRQRYSVQTKTPTTKTAEIITDLMETSRALITYRCDGVSRIRF